jgi:hypothetical protein
MEVHTNELRTEASSSFLLKVSPWRPPIQLKARRILLMSQGLLL